MDSKREIAQAVTNAAVDYISKAEALREIGEIYKVSDSLDVTSRFREAARAHTKALAHLERQVKRYEAARQREAKRIVKAASK